MSDRRNYGVESVNLGDSAIYEAIRKIGMQKYTGALPGIIEAFTSGDRSACCTDEGLTGYLRDPGICILEYAANPKSRYRIAKRLLDAGVDKLKGHGGCGAGEIAYCIEKGWSAGTHVKPYAVDKYVKRYVRELADIMSEMSSIDISWEFVPEEKLNRPNGYHDAQGLVINTTESPFIPCTGFPKSFMLSAADFNRDMVLENIDVVLSIAFGEKGFKDGFTPKNPFHITIIKDPYQPGIAINLRRSLEHVAKRPEYEYCGRIHIDEFTAPWAHEIESVLRYPDNREGSPDTGSQILPEINFL